MHRPAQNFPCVGAAESIYGNTETPSTGMVNPLKDQVVVATSLAESYQAPTLDEDRFCTNCGATMPSDAHFCSECGLSESQSRKEAMKVVLVEENLAQYYEALQQQGCAAFHTSGRTSA